MTSLSRRELLKLAAAYGASLALPSSLSGERTGWTEAAEYYPHGVASGDPQATSVLLWTRRAPLDGPSGRHLTVQLARDPDFRAIVSTGRAFVDASSDWTCRVLMARLQPATEYWYRFTDADGNGSRVGRTITAPANDDTRPVRFTFVSCQNAQLGAMNAYRRMLQDDSGRPADERLQFVMHLGDFVYEVTWYPEDRPTYYARTVRETVRYRDGEKIRDFHVPTTLEDYRALYRAYLLDPDLQDARAQWPFVNMWDNHEFSWKGWQTLQNFGAGARATQKRKVAANQAWFEYQPARVQRWPAQSGGARDDDRFHLPAAIDNAPIKRFDEYGMGEERNNELALRSLTAYRALRFGANVELILTDNRSYRSEPPMNRTDAAPLRPRDFPAVVSEHVVEVLDAGRAYANGNPPATIAIDGADVANPRRSEPPSSMLGATQRDWFFRTLRESQAPWKLWGNSVAMLDWRIDFQNLPAGAGPAWPVSGYAQVVDDDWSAYRHSRAEVEAFIREHGVGGVVSLAGDRHAFLAGGLPGIAEFVTGSVSAPGISEALEYGVPASHPLKPIYSAPGLAMPSLWGVRSTLAYQRDGDVRAAFGLRNAELAPDTSFVDAAGHGYVRIDAARDRLRAELVCIERPLARQPDGGAERYRVTYELQPWIAGAVPRLTVVSTTGQLPPGTLPPS
ncbi:MAG TPA: alkaline phosphatase D family protein [Gemmatimonadaceae bacterium]|nr:alkaline phosphatase D family protein [Gemmatimonadaceae bacterium]